MTTLIAGTFVVSLLVILASYWLFVVRPETHEKVSLVARLRGVRKQISSISVARAPERLSHIPALESMLARRKESLGPLRQLLVESGLKMNVGTFVLATFVAGAGVAVFTWMVFHVLTASIVLGLGAAMLPLLYVRFKRTKRLQLFEEQFPEAIDLIARALRAGHALTTGLGMVAEEIPAPVGQEFKQLYDEQNFGMSLPDAMRAMARRVPVLDARFFVTAVLTQREAGGNLSEVLDNLASVMRERFKLKRQIRVASAHGRISAWVLSCLPPALAGVLFLLSPNFMRILWDDPWGVQLMLMAMTLQIVGTIVISRLVKIEYEMEMFILAPLAVVFVSIAVAAGAAAWLLTDPQLMQRRLSTVAVASAGAGAARSASLVGDRLPAAVKRIRSFVPKSPKEMNRIQRLLASAGYHGPWPVTVFAAAQYGIPMVLFGSILAWFGPDGVVVISAILAAMIGYFVPTLWLGRAIGRRQREIQNGLPDAIDLMIVCIESGSGIDQALNRVAEELVLPYPALAKELEMISAETRAGKPRLEAFKNFAARTKVDDVRSLVAMLVQTDRFGTSIGMALRTHAETSRTKRRQRAEEKAAKLAVKLLFPLVFCLFPAFYLVVLGPSMLNIYRHFVNGFAG